ncbi:MAG TPA: hypothetical protein VLG91_02595, partial [Streptomyces sp.]|nr:hypothetical protein [Streptomyces sp.]
MCFRGDVSPSGKPGAHLLDGWDPLLVRASRQGGCRPRSTSTPTTSGCAGGPASTAQPAVIGCSIACTDLARHNRRIPTAAEELLSALEPLPFPARLTLAARTARGLAGDGTLAPLLTELDGRGPYE